MKKARPEHVQPSPEKRFWVWVTGPQYYWDEQGKDRRELDPKAKPSERIDTWWTCHRDTKPGDLVLLYRTRPKGDIAYLLEARSNAKIWREYPVGTMTETEYGRQVDKFFDNPKNRNFLRRFEAIDAEFTKLGVDDDHLNALYEEHRDDVPVKYRDALNRHEALIFDINQALGLEKEPELAGEWEGSWVCDYTPRFKLEVPVSRRALLADRFLAKEWPALRANFRQRVYGIPAGVWEHLIEVLAKRNAGFRSMVDRLVPIEMSQDILSEKRLEDALETNLQVLGPQFDLEPFTGPDGTSGRQYPCRGNGGGIGFIDLLCSDRKTGGLLVIELKVVRAGLAAFAQLRSYIGWVKENLANGRPVKGLLISDGHDEKFRLAANASDDISFLDLSTARKCIGF